MRNPPRDLGAAGDDGGPPIGVRVRVRVRVRVQVMAEATEG
jgi:hypothetical protein